MINATQFISPSKWNTLPVLAKQAIITRAIALNELEQVDQRSYNNLMEEYTRLHEQNAPNNAFVNFDWNLEVLMSLYNGQGKVNNIHGHLVHANQCIQKPVEEINAYIVDLAKVFKNTKRS